MNRQDPLAEKLANLRRLNALVEEESRRFAMARGLALSVAFVVFVAVMARPWWTAVTATFLAWLASSVVAHNVLVKAWQRRVLTPEERSNVAN